MTVGELWDVIDFGGLPIVIWDVDDEGIEDSDPIWEGTAYQLPYWISKLKLIKAGQNNWDEAVSYRASLGEKYNNKPGFVIVVKE